MWPGLGHSHRRYSLHCQHIVHLAFHGIIGVRGKTGERQLGSRRPKPSSDETVLLNQGGKSGGCGSGKLRSRKSLSLARSSTRHASRLAPSDPNTIQVLTHEMAVKKRRRRQSSSSTIQPAPFNRHSSTHGQVARCAKWCHGSASPETRDKCLAHFCLAGLTHASPHPYPWGWALDTSFGRRVMARVLLISIGIPVALVDVKSRREL